MLDVLRLRLDTCNLRGLSSVSPSSSIFKLTHVFFFSTGQPNWNIIWWKVLYATNQIK